MSHIIVNEIGNEVHITLNRPEALNALNHDMVLDITKALHDYKLRDDIQKIIFRGAGDRAFCAGGDVKSVYYAGMENPKTAWRYFYDEYEMNKIIHAYPKTIISLCHGFVMGGGYGVAGNGAHIIVCDNTKFAMPETAIGFFPDVGIGWKLARAGALGMYIALTGSAFDADMMMESGMATHKISESDMMDYLNSDKPDPIESLLQKSIEPHSIQNKDKIEKTFSNNTLLDIFKVLEEGDDFEKQTLDILKSRSPISLHVTYHHLLKASAETFNESIARDYTLACAFFTKHDIYEGIRAALIDKDKEPQWESSSIFNISQVDIDYYFNFIDHSG